MEKFKPKVLWAIHTHLSREAMPKGASVRPSQGADMQMSETKLPQYINIRCEKEALQSRVSRKGI